MKTWHDVSPKKLLPDLLPMTDLEAWIIRFQFTHTEGWQDLAREFPGLADALEALPDAEPLSRCWAGFQDMVAYALSDLRPARGARFFDGQL